MASSSQVTEKGDIMTQERFRTFASEVLRGDEISVNELISFYYGDGRHYHDGGHVLHCIDILDAVHHGAFDPFAIKVALLYHDSIYDSAAHDNEDRSAELAGHRLPVHYQDAAFCDRVGRLILATKHRGGLTDHDEQVMADVDLAAGLGADYSTFSYNTRLIRFEYNHLSDVEYDAGRRSFFRSMLGRPLLFHTRPFRLLFEARARENMTRAIAD